MDISSLEQFNADRQEGNDLVMKYAGLQLKRLYHIDDAAYKEGALPAKTKELLGLVSSLVLRCDDCITYHVQRCHEEGVNAAELEEAITIGYVVGGSIVVPHMRRAFARWEQLEEKSPS